MARASTTSENVPPKDGERRKTILRAAIDVFASKGYHGCRIADVAREAGVAYGLVYHYFQNKEELLASVFDAAWGGFTSRLRTVVSAPGTLEDHVRSIVRLAFDAYRADPQGVRVLILEIARSPSGSFNRQSAFIEVMTLVRNLFLEAQANGELREDQDPVLAAALLWGAIEMGLTAFVLGLEGGQTEQAIERAKHQVVDAFLNGVRPSAPTTGSKPPSMSAQRRKRRSE